MCMRASVSYANLLSFSCNINVTVSLSKFVCMHDSVYGKLMHLHAHTCFAPPWKPFIRCIKEVCFLISRIILTSQSVLCLMSPVSIHGHSVQEAQRDMLCHTIIKFWKEDWRKMRGRYNPACGNSGWPWYVWRVLWYTREVRWSSSPPTPYLPTYITITSHPPPPNNGWHLSD